MEQALNIARLAKTLDEEGSYSQSSLEELYERVKENYQHVIQDLLILGVISGPKESAQDMIQNVRAYILNKKPEKPAKFVLIILLEIFWQKHLATEEE